MTDAPLKNMPVPMAAERIFEIRRLYHEGVVVRTAALLSLSVLRFHPHERIQRLCERVADDIDHTAAGGGQQVEALP